MSTRRRRKYQWLGPLFFTVNGVIGILSYSETEIQLFFGFLLLVSLILLAVGIANRRAYAKKEKGKHL